MSNHPTSLYGIPPAELGRQLAGMRYDALATVLQALGAKLLQDGDADRDRSRVKLSGSLYGAAFDVNSASEDITDAWKICEPHEV
jgi:hypothetical protein